MLAKASGRVNPKIKARARWRSVEDGRVSSLSANAAAFPGGDTAALCPYDGWESRRAMSHNTFGHLFRVTTFGESHGPALGCVVDGCPPGIPLDAAEIQADLDRRRPGQSRFTTQRREPDAGRRSCPGVFADEPHAAGR